MEDIIFEQDYTRQEKTPETERAEAIFNQAIDGGFFKAFADAMDKIPKIIVQKDKENYEYLLDRLDAVAKRKHGRIRGIVDYHKWESHIAFTVKDAAKVSEELLMSATKNAREKAEILCRASGAELGNLQSIEYNWGELNIVSRTNYEMEDCIMPVMALRECAVPEIEPDDIDLRDTATFVWEIA